MMRTARRWRAGVAAFVALVSLTAASGLVFVASAAAAGSATAVVVIDTGSNVRSAVIHFDGTISGIDALELAGANPVTYAYSGQGAAVCELDGVGNPPNSCLVGPNGEYWAYWLAHGGATSWSYARGCACTTTVSDGDVEGWRYGTGAAPRASASFCSYVSCAPPPAPTTVPSGGGTTSGGSDTNVGADAGATGPSAGTAAPAGGAAGAAPGASTASTAVTAAPDASTTSEPTSTSSAATTTRRPRRDDDQQVAAFANGRHGGGGNGAGSPVGVAVAGGVLGAAAAGAVWLRRRRVRAPSG